VRGKVVLRGLHKTAALHGKLTAAAESIAGMPAGVLVF
jgi:hypothetical protein